MRKLFLLLTVCVLSHTKSLAVDNTVDITVDVNAIVGVQFNLYPTKLTGETYWEDLYAITDRSYWTIGNSYENVDFGKNAYVLSDESAFSVVANRYVWRKTDNNYEFIYFDYILTPQKEGIYTFKHKLVYVHDGSYTNPQSTIYQITYNIQVASRMNYLYGSDFKGGAGGQVSLPIFMENDINVRDFQFDLVLPGGVTVATKDGSIDATVTDRTSSYTLEGRTLSSGATRIMAYTLSDALVSGTEGAVMNIRLIIDKDTPLGEYDVKLTNVQLSEKNGTNINTVYAPDWTFKMEVRPIAKGDVNADGIVNIADVSSIISYILEEMPTWFTESVADVNGDGQIDVTDVIAIIDIIMSE